LRRFRHWLLLHPGYGNLPVGYVRFQTNFGRDAVQGGAFEGNGNSGWDTFTRSQLQIDAKNDTELGTLESVIVLQTNADAAGNSDATFLDTASFAIAGFKFGYYYSWWDDGIAGETDALATNTLFNSISYAYDGGAFKAGISVDELEGIGRDPALGQRNSPNDFGRNDNGVGVAARIAGSVGGVTATLLGGYQQFRAVWNQAKMEVRLRQRRRASRTKTYVRLPPGQGWYRYPPGSAVARPSNASDDNAICPSCIT
jgi:Porin subfamily